MIRALVDFALNNKFVVAAVAVALLLLGSAGERSHFTTCPSKPIPISATTM